MTTTTTPFEWMTPGATGTHPVTALVERLSGELDDLVETPVWSMSAAQARDTLAQVARLSAQVAALELRVVAHADRVQAGEGVGATTTGAWWAVATRQYPAGGAPQGEAGGGVGRGARAGR